MKMRLPLKLENNMSILFDEERTKRLVETLEKTIYENSWINDLNFAKSVMEVQEIKANNNIEGYFDNVELINAIINNPNAIKNDEIRKRILNLYRGYRFILGNCDINKDSLRELYNVLSNGLVSDDDIMEMGTYYRKNMVYIHDSIYADAIPDHGVQSCNIDYLMNCLFGYIDSQVSNDLMTNYFIRSQIAHFYFVYIHPYYDINGRTARTTAMWYLLNNNCYPFIIFNRGISNDKKNYYRKIKQTKASSDVTPFVCYMLDTVLMELEKESVIHSIVVNSLDKFSTLDYQSLNYLLSIKGLKTILDFVTYYMGKNDKIKVKEIIETMLMPLVDKKIIVLKRPTNKVIYPGMNNYVIEFNESKIALDRSRLRKLTF